MKKASILITLMLAVITASAQFQEKDSLNQSVEKPENVAITLGFLHGGGGLVGMDLEVLVHKYIGIEVGAGVVSYGGSLNIHPKGGIRSSAIRINYWHQGIGDTYVQALLGPAFQYRSKGGFTANLGLAARIEEGPAITEKLQKTEAVLTYGVGYYFGF